MANRYGYQQNIYQNNIEYAIAINPLLDIGMWIEFAQPVTRVENGLL